MTGGYPKPIILTLTHPGTLQKDVCVALDMDSDSVEVVGLEDIKADNFNLLTWHTPQRCL